ncbi:unnamed protein product [Caenorhabditis nigoni]
MANSYLSNPSTGSIPAGYSQFGFWIDGTRKPECYYPQKAGANCSGQNEFNFTDPNAPNPTLKWLAGQPDGLPQKTNADCVYYYARDNSQSGIDDMLCQNSVFSHQNICMVGYYCGSRLGPDTWT